MNSAPIIRPIDHVDPQEVPRSPGVTIQVLLGPADEMPNFYMRIFTMPPGTRIPAHGHDIIEHQQLMLEGRMHVTFDGEPRVVEAGEAVYIPAGCAHSYENRGQVPVRFLCMVPPTAEYSTDWVGS